MIPIIDEQLNTQSAAHLRIQLAMVVLLYGNDLLCFLFPLTSPNGIEYNSRKRNLPNG